MASTSQMLFAGLSLAVNTIVLIMMAIAGGAIFQPLLKWYYSYQYTSAPPINPGMVTWIFPVFFGMLLVIEIVLIIVCYQMAITQVDYYPEYMM
jgi:hypothetical protein